MIDLKIILFSIIWLNLCSCKEVKNNEDTYTEEDKVYQLRKKNIQVSCLILRNIDSTAAIVQDKGAKSIITDSTDDNCLLQYVDSISTRLIKSPKKIYFKNLESINDVSDGYLSEYMSEIAYEQFKKNFEVFYNFYSKEDKTNMKLFIFNGVISHIEFSEDKKIAKHEAIRICKSYKALYKRNQFLDDLLYLLNNYE